MPAMAAREATLDLLRPYNPWWGEAHPSTGTLPDFERPIVSEVLADLAELPQIVSITGPRRVGKSTALRQVIRQLLRRAVPPDRIVYFSFDDPALFIDLDRQRRIFDEIVQAFVERERLTYFCFDEIQRLPAWELFLKKAYDVKLNARFVISGSASSPIFRKSHESLLGRIKDRHLLAFSFREFASFRLQGEPGFAEALSSVPDLRGALLTGDPAAAESVAREVQRTFAPFNKQLHRIVKDFTVEGGFPEIWELSDPVRKIEYLMEQQVRKVLFEDLSQLAEYRKPENVLRLFLYLLAHPGVELNIARISKEASLERRIIDENLPRLELTDLIVRVHKFRHEPLRVRTSNIKCYPTDLSLRNAVLKTWEPPDERTMGYFAEALVLRTLLDWREVLGLSYYRERDSEIDFIVTHGGDRHLPIEVKHREPTESFRTLERFTKKYEVPVALAVTRALEVSRDEILRVPLRYFLLAA
jgi:uncharacterized protein